MHDCLLIPELAARIAEACAPQFKRPTSAWDADGEPYLASLCALARTCRALEGPALDVIWYYQFGLQNLIQCLPKHLWKMIVARGGYHELKFNTSGRITQQAWRRFDFYAHRVRKLECSQYFRRNSKLGRDYAETESVVRVLWERKGSPLLPNIQSVHWTVRNISGPSLDALRSLFTPTMYSLDLNIVPGVEGQLPIDLMIALTTSCPNLQRVLLRFPANLLYWGSPLLALNECSTLRRFSLTISDGEGSVPRKLSSSFLSQLAALSNLSELHFSDCSTYVGDQDIAQPHRFPSVKLLRLYLDSMLSASKLWEACEFAFLKELSIEYNKPGSDFAAPLKLLSRIISSVSSNTLEALVLYTRIKHVSVPLQNDSVDASPLHPLLAFSNLRRLVFDTAVEITLTDADLETFARAWPHLRTLHINNRKDILTYRDLAVLVRLCPDLFSLRISITATPTIGPDDLADLPVSENAVKLDFSASALGDADSTALWIAKMFPHRVPTSEQRTAEELRVRWAQTDIQRPFAGPLQASWEDVFILAERRNDEA